MNKKGFTMVELLVVIALIALMSVLLTINMTGVLSEQKGVSYTTIKNRIASAAYAYINKQSNHELRDKYKNDPNGGVVSLGTLVSEGLIDGEIKDPRNGKTLEEEGSLINVKIIWVNKEQQFIVED